MGGARSRPPKPCFLARNRWDYLNCRVRFYGSAVVAIQCITRKITPTSLCASFAFLVLGVLDRTVGGAGYYMDTYIWEHLTTFFQVAAVWTNKLVECCEWTILLTGFVCLTWLPLAVTAVYNISLVFSKFSVLFLYERFFSVDCQL